MDTHLLFMIVGLGAGAMYAGLGMGIVVVHRGAGVVNVAQGAMAMWSAFVFDELRSTGDLVLPIGRIDLAPRSVHLWSALGLALVTAMAVGLLAHLLVFHPLRAAPPLARVVASVGVMITMEALVVLRFGTKQRQLAPLLPDERVELAGLSFSRDRITLAIGALAVAAVLTLYFRRTRLGLATLGASENELAASLSGYSPPRLAAVTWTLGITVSSLLVLLVVPSVGLNPTNVTLFVIPALAAALLGRLTSVWVTCVAGLLIGAFQAEVTLLSTQPWWPEWASVGAADALPFVVVVVALFVFGRGLPSRGTTEPGRLPAAVIPRLRPGMVVGVAVGGLAALVLTDGSLRFGVITSMIVAIIALSLVLLTGYVGQISLAQAAFAGAAGFALSRFSTKLGLGFPWALLLSVAMAGALGLIVGLPALRVRGTQLAVVTLAAAVVVERFIFRNPNLSPP